MRNEKELEGISLLGNHNTKYRDRYSPEVLEKFNNKHCDTDYMVKLKCPEFTSLCPKTGQPDFAKMYINYIPEKYLVESKSLKLYLFSFRNSGDFHEDVVNVIKNDLVSLLKPKYLEVIGYFYPRGGISIFPYAIHVGDKKYEDLKNSRIEAICDEQ